MKGVDEAVEQLERLYRTVTGTAAPSGPSPHAPIPPEKDPIRHVEEQIERLLSALGEPVPLVRWTPRAAFFEGEHETLLQLEVPGVPRDSLTVSIANGVLTVSGSRPAPLLGTERPTPRGGEIPRGPFTRSFAVPRGVATPNLSAQLRDGMLDIRIPPPSVPRPVGQETTTVVVR